MSNRSGNWDIYRIDAVNGAAQQLTDSAGRDGLATASPDGNYIAFVSDRDGAWAVYVMDANGATNRRCLIWRAALAAATAIGCKSELAGDGRVGPL
ncbi:MAG: hypothetical protein R2867_18555 [Caldilineaceae bacterium]